MRRGRGVPSPGFGDDRSTDRGRGSPGTGSEPRTPRGCSTVGCQWHARHRTADLAWAHASTPAPSKPSRAQPLRARRCPRSPPWGLGKLRPRERLRPRGVIGSLQRPGPGPRLRPLGVPDKGPPWKHLRRSPWFQPQPTTKPLPRPPGLALLLASLPEMCLNEYYKQMGQSWTITLGFLCNKHKTGCGWGCLLSASQGARAPRGPAEQPCPAKAPLDPGLTAPAPPCLQSPQAPGSEAINESPGCSAFGLPGPWRARPQGPSCGHGSFLYLADSDLVLPMSLMNVHFLPHKTLQGRGYHHP